jgi:anaerobic magnesium-protoporphyrin IX monomethyl ester cyclase
LLAEQILKSRLADYICIGEVDETIVNITSDISSKKAQPIIKSPLPVMENLLPTPWHLIEIEKYIHKDVYLKSGRNLDVGQSSRGCPFACGFCSSASIRERKWRAMSSGKSLEMIEKAVKDFNLSGIWLRDDEFYINHDRAAEIAEGIIPLNIKWYTSGTRVDVFNKTPDDQIDLYKRSGASTLKFGAESGSNRILKLMNKGITKEETILANLKIKKHGITPAFALMLGFPGETFSEMEETIDLARQLRKDNPQAQFETMATYTALPGTPMWDLAIKYGLKSPTNLAEWSDWNFDEYDLEGKRIPWFNKKERQSVVNLCYLSMLSNAIPNLIDSLESPIMSKVAQMVYAMPHKYFQWRFFDKHYKESLDLNIIRNIRKRIFYSGHRLIR